MGIRPRACEQQRALVDELLRHRLRDPLEPLVVVVPSWLAAVQVRRRLADEGAGAPGHAGVRFFTPAALIERLGGYLAAEAGLQPLPRWGLELLTYRAARRTGYFGELADRPGFAAALARTVRQLRLWGVAPERLQAQAGAAGGPRERQRWLDLAGIYGAVCRFLAPAGDDFGGGAAQPRFTDLAGLAALAGRCADEGLAPALLGAEEVWLWGVEEALDGARLWAQLVKRLQGPASGLRVRQLAFLGSRGDDAALEPLAVPGDVALRVVPCATELEEAEWVARELLSAAEAGVPFWRMAVVLRHGRPYRHLVAGALARAQVPAFLAGGVGLPPGPAARAVAGWVALLRDGPTRPALLEWLRTAPLRAGWAGLRPEHVQPARWEALTVQAGLAGDPAGWAGQLERWLARRGPSAPDDEAARALVGALRTSAAELGQMPRQGRWVELAGALAGWMERTLQPAGDFEAVLGVVKELARLDELDQAAGDNYPVTLPLFAEAVLELLARQEDPSAFTTRFEQGSVAVLAAEEALGCSFDVVAMPGLVRGRFPLGPPGDAVLASHELERLADLPPGTLAAAHARRERLLFAWAVSCAHRRCVLSFARAEGAGAREQPPSPFLEELHEAGLVRGDAESLQAVAAVALDVHELRRRLAGAQRAGAGGWLARLYPHAAAGAKAHEARRRGPPGVFDGCLGPASTEPAATAATGSPAYTPTELETYARCPRLYLFSRLLGVEVAEEPEASEGLAGLLRGQVVHLALRRFYERLADPPGAGGQWQEELARAVAGAVEEMGSGVTDAAAFARVQAEVLLGVLVRLVQAEQQRPPDGRLVRRLLEQPFGGLSVAAHGDGRRGDEPVRLRGRIDRLEVLEQDGRQRVRVIDYKTGRPTGKGADSLEQGLQLQPAVYLLAASRMTGVPPKACRAALVYLDTPTLPRWVELDGAAWDALQPRLEQVLATLTRGIRQGYFAPDPHPDFGCERCHFYALCGPQARRFRERGGPQLFPELQEMRGAAS